MQSGLEHLPHEKLKTDNIWPLSFAQEGLWFLHELEPNNSAYNICRLLRFKGELNVEALSWSLNQIVERHETLRTSFGVCDEQPCQIISSQASLDLVMEDLSHLPDVERWPAAMELAETDAKRPFDLRQGPLLRARLLRLAPTEYALLLCVHHIICDGWSIEVWFGELEQFYNCACTRVPVPLADLPIQYADYALWQREWLQGNVLEEQLAYWREELSGAEGVLELPTDRPRPAVKSYRGDIGQWQLSEGLTRQLEQFAQKQEATLFMVLLAAFQALLWRYTGNKDVVVGTPVAKRQRLEVEGLIGLLVNTLALRARIMPNESFEGLLAQVKETCLGGYAHQELPFEKLVKELQPERSLAHSPLFQVMLTLPGTPRNELNLHQLRTQIEVIHYAASKCDLSVTVLYEPAGELKLAVEYNTDLFEEQTIGRMMAHLQQLLRAVCTAPDQRVRAIPLLTDAERRQLCEWNSTAVDYGLGCVQEVIEEQVKHTPEAIAICFAEQKLTYRELNERANQLAHYLRRQGVGAEVLVGILMTRSVEMVVALLGILKAGGAYLPLDASYPAARLRYMLQDSGARLILTTGKLVELVASASEAGVQVIKVDEQWGEIALESGENLNCEVTADNLAYMIYTSGSTGHPKGVMIPHGGLTNHTAWMQQIHPLGDDDAVLQRTSYSFDASMLELFWPLISGARLILAKDQADLDTDYLTKLIDEHQITTVYFPASALRMFLANRKAGTCHSLEYVCSAAEAMPLDVEREFFSQFPSVELHNLYGPTEATIDVTWWPCEKNSDRRSVPIGRPIANTQVYVLDEWLEPAPLGVTGELYLGGAGLARGYWRQPGLTAERFVPNPYGESGARLYRTGDLVRYLADGELEFLGRADSQVKLRGYRIELGEIEAVLRGHDEVREALVEVRQVESCNQQLVAYVVLRTVGGEEQVRELRSYLRERLPEYMVPGPFVRLEAMPLTPSGKVDRRALPAPTLDQANGGAFVAPRGQTEQELAEIWEQLLQIEPIGVRDNFFDLGGHSLLATQLVSRILTRFAVDLKLQDIFIAPTIEGLAALTDSALIEMSDEAGFEEALEMLEHLADDEIPSFIE
ncbi:MAG: amino acid adenylation domain-containing protein [Acidobacteriota bacterium]